MGIHRSLQLGNEGELFITNIFKNADIECKKHDDKETRQDYDLVCKIGRKKFTCEVKFDILSETTGNVCLEVENTKQNKPSGLYATKSTLWCMVMKDGDNKVAYTIEVEKLKKWVEANKPFKKFSRAGDYNSSIILYKNDDILPVFTRIDNISIEDLQKKIRKMI